MVFDPNGLQHGLLPEAPSPKVSRQSINNAECENAFNGTGNDTEGQRVSVVLVPGLNVECKECYGMLA